MVELSMMYPESPFRVDLMEDDMLLNIIVIGSVLAVVGLLIWARLEPEEPKP